MCQSIANDIMEPISQTRPTRALWQKLATMYANKSNVSKTVRLYEDLFACKQGTRTLQSYYGAIEAIFTNLAIYQPTSTDAETLARYKNELRAGAFLSGLRPELADMIRGQVLGGTRVMTIEEIFAAALWVQDSLPPSSVPPTSEVSALVVLGGPSTASGQGSSSGKPRNSFPPCKYCGKTSHPAEKCWKEFGKPAWVLAATGGKQLFASIGAHTPCVPTSVVSPASVPPGSIHIVISPSELAYLQASRASALHTPPSASTSLASLASSFASYTGGNASTPGTSALTASHDISWVIDSRASAHMTGTPSVLTSYRPNPSIPAVHIVDGRPCLVHDSGTSQASSAIPLHHVLYVPGFPKNLLSISAITKTLHCGVFFYPHHCIF